jgi:hypothetical protein
MAAYPEEVASMLDRSPKLASVVHRREHHTSGSPEVDPVTRLNTALDGRSRVARPPLLGLTLSAMVALAAACMPDAGGGQDRLSTGWPDWQRIEANEPPATWQIEEASFAFDAWEASVVVTELAASTDATTIQVDDGDGGVLDVRLARLPSGALEPSLEEGDAVRVQLIRRQGFEGVAQGLAVRDGEGRLLLLYDDGGYGPAFYEDGARGGVAVNRSLLGPSSGDEWESRDVTFELEGESLVLAEGESARLGDTGLAVSVVVSREWTGEPPTDIDLTPLAYLIFRAR